MAGLRDFFAGYQSGNDLVEDFVGKRKQGLLAQYATRAYEGDKSAIGQAYQVDPRFGVGLEQQSMERQQAASERQREALGRHASVMVALPRAQREAYYRSAARDDLRAAGINVPDDYSDEVDAYVPEVARAVAGTGSGAAVQSTRVGADGYYYTVDRMGRWTNSGVKADPSVQVVEGAGGFYGVDRRNMSATPVQIGGTSRASGEVPFSIDPSLPDNVQDAIRADEASFAATPNGGTVYIGGGQLQPPSEKPPGGYVWNSDRSALNPIPGGPADEPPPTAGDFAKDEMAMRKELADLNKDDNTITSSFSKVNAAARNPSAQNDLALIFSYMKMLDPGSVVREGEFANAQNTGGIPERVWNAYNSALNGERLNAGQRLAFVSSARDLYNGATQRITQRTRQQAETAEAYGFDPTRATGSRMGSAQFRQQYDKAGDLLKEAREAIKGGANREAVRRRLVEMGFNNIAGRL